MTSLPDHSTMQVAKTCFQRAAEFVEKEMERGATRDVLTDRERLMRLHALFTAIADDCGMELLSGGSYAYTYNMGMAKNGKPKIVSIDCKPMKQE